MMGEYENQGTWLSSIFLCGLVLTKPVAGQIQEMEMIRNKIYTLEQTTMDMKQKLDICTLSSCLDTNVTPGMKAR